VECQGAGGRLIFGVGGVEAHLRTSTDGAGEGQGDITGGRSLHVGEDGGGNCFSRIKNDLRDGVFESWCVGDSFDDGGILGDGGGDFRVADETAEKTFVDNSLGEVVRLDKVSDEGRRREKRLYDALGLGKISDLFGELGVTKEFAEEFLTSIIVGEDAVDDLFKLCWCEFIDVKFLSCRWHV